jgi:hypothetical protein
MIRALLASLRERSGVLLRPETTPQHWVVLDPCNPRLNLQKLDNKIINEMSNNEIKWQSNVINISGFKIKFDVRSFINSKTFWGVNFFFLWMTCFGWVMFIQSRMIIHFC